MTKISDTNRMTLPIGPKVASKSRWGEEDRHSHHHVLFPVLFFPNENKGAAIMLSATTPPSVHHRLALNVAGHIATSIIISRGRVQSTFDTSKRRHALGFSTDRSPYRACGHRWWNTCAQLEVSGERVMGVCRDFVWLPRLHRARGDRVPQGSARNTWRFRGRPVR